MADEAWCTPLHPVNMGATCSDVRELLAPMSFHVVHGGCAGSLNVDEALIGPPPSRQSQRGSAAPYHGRLRATTRWGDKVRVEG